ncbi:MAG: hypothetical protein A3J08_03220 [Candidatus Lloydbacteria bacterium RIFCSPLOWO2_02_FULL_51_11]|nr:MAG: hypothetical protein A3J08_03220 [Candidatus Lloydbacteria bacterium RIFCSPLOWO2_02_FULL_51_11]
MLFQVPQFIEVEDKIIGPFTFKQFIYIAGGAGISFILFKIFPLFISVFLIAPVAALSLALAFYKMNDQPFIQVLESMLTYTFGKKLYTWEKAPPKKASEATEDRTEDISGLLVPRVSEGKLKDIAWSLGVEESLYSSEDEGGKTPSGDTK